MCLNENDLQEIIDDVYKGNLEEAMEHIQSCSSCNSQFQKLQMNDQDVFTLLEHGMHLPPQPVLKHEWSLEDDADTLRGLNFMKHINTKWKAVAAAALIGIMFMIEPVQVAADSFLKLFRVQEIETVSITQSDIHELDSMMRQGNGEVSIDNIGTFEFSSNGEEFFNENPENLNEITSAFSNVKVIESASGMELDYLSIIPKSTVRFTLDVKSTNEILTYLGSDEMLPESLDQKSFEMTADKLASYTFVSKQNDNDEQASINVTIMREPQIGLPKDVDAKDVVKALANSGLIPSEIKKQLMGIKGLESVIPIPYSEEQQVRSEQNINGNKAIIIENKESDEDYWDYTSVYIKDDDYFYVFNSHNVDKETLITLIKEME